MTWPMYSKACRKDVDSLLKAGGSLSAYRANPKFPSWTGPLEGSWADRLERDVVRRFGVRYAVAVNSGTAALQAALATLRLKDGEEVVTTPYSFSATVAAILLSGGRPVFADVDPGSFCISKETVKRVIGKRTRAILPVHLFGGLADLRGLQSFGLPVIEDACQAVGARSSDGYSGTQGLAGAYSFNGTKNVPAGECGMVVTNDPKVAETARYLGNHGENFHQKQVGMNFRPNEVTACIAWHGLQDLEVRNQRRQALAAEMNAVRHLDLVRAGVTRPFGPDGDESHVYYVYPFTLDARFPLPRAEFIKRMAKRGIPVGAGYITPTLDRYPAFRQYARGPLPVVHELSSKTLCILSTLTPDRPLSYAKTVADAMRESLR